MAYLLLVPFVTRRERPANLRNKRMRIDDVLRRIQGEFLEMPGLRLTTSQAQRLWGLDREICETVLQSLVSEKFLRADTRWCVRSPRWGTRHPAGRCDRCCGVEIPLQIRPAGNLPRQPLRPVRFLVPGRSIDARGQADDRELKAARLQLPTDLSPTDARQHLRAMCKARPSPRRLADRCNRRSGPADRSGTHDTRRCRLKSESDRTAFPCCEPPPAVISDPDAVDAFRTDDRSWRGARGFDDGPSDSRNRLETFEAAFLEP